MAIFLKINNSFSVQLISIATKVMKRHCLSGTKYDRLIFLPFINEDGSAVDLSSWRY
jgi:hypothetical protein